MRLRSVARKLFSISPKKAGTSETKTKFEGAMAVWHPLVTLLTRLRKLVTS